METHAFDRDALNERVLTLSGNKNKDKKREIVLHVTGAILQKYSLYPDENTPTPYSVFYVSATVLSEMVLLLGRTISSKSGDEFPRIHKPIDDGFHSPHKPTNEMVARYQSLIPKRVKGFRRKERHRSDFEIDEAD